jgi:L-arabinose isomerase
MGEAVVANSIKTEGRLCVLSSTVTACRTELTYLSVAQAAYNFTVSKSNGLNKWYVHKQKNSLGVSKSKR